MTSSNGNLSEGSNLVTFKSYQDSQGSSVYSSTSLPNYRSNCIDSEDKGIPLSLCRLNPIEGKTFCSGIQVFFLGELGGNVCLRLMNESLAAKYWQ